MNKLVLTLSVAVFLIAGTGIVFAEHHESGEPHFAVTTPKGEQEIGGKSGHASHGGLHRAEEKSPVIEHTHDHHDHEE